MPDDRGLTLPECVKKLLGPYFPGFNLDDIRIIEGLPWYVMMDAAAYTNQCSIYFAPGKYDPHSARGIALIGHEIAHSFQYKQFGAWRFRALYLESWVTGLRRYLSLDKAYGNNRFEVEAAKLQGEICRDLYDLFGDEDPCK